MNDNEPITTPYVDPALYDVVYSWYQDDLAFYVDLAKASRGPVLEVACGTGRILLPTAAAGVDIDGIDLEPAMIARLKAKADAAGLKVKVAVADMRDFTMPRRYSLITIPFRAFMHLPNTEDQIRALRCIREHLEPEGSLVMNVFYPNHAYIATHRDQRMFEREFEHPSTGRSVALWSTQRYDIVQQTLTSDREMIETAEDGSTVTHPYRFALRWVYRFEMELLLRAAGFTRCDVRGGFDGRPLANPSDEMVWTAWKG